MTAHPAATRRQRDQKTGGHMTAEARIGRCQHCAQTRPLFKHDGELQFWGYNPDDEAWLCARDYSARELAIENDEDFAVDHGIKPFAEQATEAAR